MRLKPEISLSEFNSSFTPEPYSGCWLWIKRRHGQGYGYAWRNRHNVYAHRVAWELYRGEIPTGLHVLHRCDTPSCVNPNHLFLGTHRDNMRDSERKGRRPHAKGEKHWATKLTAAEVQKIRQSNESQRKTATRFGLKQATVWNIKHRRTWKHLGG